MKTYSYVCSLSSVPSQIFEAYSFRKWNRIVIRIKHSVTNDLKIMCIDNIRWSKFYFMNEYFSVFNEGDDVVKKALEEFNK